MTDTTMTGMPAVRVPLAYAVFVVVLLWDAIAPMVLHPALRLRNVALRRQTHCRQATATPTSHRKLQFR